jgi:hypothetical protein
MAKLWTSLVALVVVLAAGFCAKVQCESERRLRELDDKVLGLELHRGDVDEGAGKWWCGKGDADLCSRSRRGCETGDSTLASAPKILECEQRRVAYCIVILPTSEQSGAREQPFLGCSASLATCHRADTNTRTGRVVSCIGVE